MLWPTSVYVAASAFLTSTAFGVRLHGRDINAQLLESYDYIVVGCGISGLVVTNRLSEIASRTVLCIEAGDADHYEAIIQDPVYVGSDVGGIYDWNLVTVPQTQLDGNTRPMPQGKALGGGSILNAMCWNRGGADDYDTWEALGNPGWGWEGMLPYFMKSETYTPVYSEAVAEEYSINYNPAVHGTSGPVQVSYPKYFYPQSVNLFAAMNLLGLPTQFDPNDGTSAGPALVPTDLDPNNQTRSDARRTYYDPYVGRDNFHVITGQHVTRILTAGVGGNGAVSNPTTGGNSDGNGPSSGNNNGFGFGPGGSTPPLSEPPPSRFTRRQDPGTSDLRITGVEFAANASAPRQTVYATREVIVAAGSLHSAQLLQLSGYGPAGLLNQFDIPIALDLPGVGNNLQDHCLVGTFYPYNNASYPLPTELTTNATYNLEAEQEYETEKTGPWTAGSPNALAFNPLPLITNNSAIILLNATFQAPTDYLLPGLDSTIVAGFAAQKQSLATRLGRTTTAAYEIINNNAGSLTVAVMHPFSRGTCYIQSSDPFQPPAIDPRWLTNPVDRQILVEALFFNRQILATPPMVELQAAQFVPPANANEEAINQVIDNGIRTEFHPSGTIAMLPLERGGVVDSHLRVWGTQNLRVVDASIFPMIPAAHLQAVVYAVAEKAADIIKADNLPSSAIPVSSSTSPPNPAATAASQSANPSASSLQRLVANITISLSTSTALTVDSTTNMAATSTPELASVSTMSPSSGGSSIVSVLPSSFSAANSATHSLLSAVVPLGQPSISIGDDASTAISASLTTTSLTALEDQIVTRDLPTSTHLTSLSSEILSSQVPTMSTTSKIIDEATTTSPMSVADQISSSILNVLTSVRIPSSVGAPLVPVIIGSPTEPTADASSSSMETETQLEERRVAIGGFIQWVKNFFS